jgi:hypothetical protein
VAPQVDNDVVHRSGRIEKHSERHDNSGRR